MSVVSAASALKGVGAFIPADVWFAASDFLKQYDTKGELATAPFFRLPYSILVNECIQIVMEGLERTGLEEDETVAFIFEDNECKGESVEGYDIYRAGSRTNTHLGSLTFAGKNRFPGLQAADLLAWQYRRVTELRRGLKLGQLDRNVRRIIREDWDPRQFGYFTKESLITRLESAVQRILQGQV